MPKRVISCVHAISVGLLATVIMLGTNYATLAADNCLAGPNREPAQGGHWYYHRDRAGGRKCWYLVEPGAQTATAEAPESQPSPDPTQPPRPFSSFFSSLSSGLTGSTGTQPDTTGDARVMQTARPDDLKSDGASPGRQPRMVRHPDSEAALAPKPHRPAHARPPAEHTEEQPAASLDQTERDALFQEFLRWRESQ